MNWCFAIINRRLSELFFEKRGRGVKFLGFAHVKRDEYGTKREQKMIDKDIIKHRFTYRGGKYTRIKVLK
ncbi:MAG: Uncharacterized protein G01um101416_666 [Microgenomates group bacterium Gr01-1014_16]|nr:MAG: Uncharacterized protein G01um101416_666 [Microgenomates group bacterium Gr01-1014_16]